MIVAIFYILICSYYIFTYFKWSFEVPLEFLILLKLSDQFEFFSASPFPYN